MCDGVVHWSGCPIWKCSHNDIIWHHHSFQGGNFHKKVIKSDEKSLREKWLYLLHTFQISAVYSGLREGEKYPSRMIKDTYLCCCCQSASIEVCIILSTEWCKISLVKVGFLDAHSNPTSLSLNGNWNDSEKELFVFHDERQERCASKSKLL